MANKAGTRTLTVEIQLADSGEVKSYTVNGKAIDGKSKILASTGQRNYIETPSDSWGMVDEITFSVREREARQASAKLIVRK